MFKLMQRLNKVVSSFRQQLVNTNLESIEEVLFTPEQTTAFDEELTDQEAFHDFHVSIGTGDSELDHAYHCSASSQR